MRASLLHGGNRQGVLAKAKETDALGIKDQAPGTLFMVFGQVDLQSIFVRSPSMNNTIFLVEVRLWPSL
jgi:hypothetical protein